MRRALLATTLVVSLGVAVAGAATLGVTEEAVPAEHHTAYRPPPGWQTYTYHGVAISVPRSWTVAYFQTCLSDTQGTLVIGTPTSGPALLCPDVSAARPLKVVALRGMRDRRAPTGAPARVVHCLRLYAVRGAIGRAWTVPSRHLEVLASGAGSTGVVRTLRRS